MRRRRYPRSNGTARTALVMAFRALRRQGYIARMNHLCCSSCAGYSIGTAAEERVAAGRAAPTGAVYWHRQDEAGYRESGKMYVRFGGIHTERFGLLGKKDAEVAADILAALRDVAASASASGLSGVTVEWCGDTGRCIEVLDAGRTR